MLWPKVSATAGGVHIYTKSSLNWETPKMITSFE